ncbi:hypothetical protein WN71_033345 [Streptomyces mangrovisoli]|uniref:Uncharacterized protein n=1 Tax=Streptomyces mangrovisoli TaxID=1428628 RepID=A0A1J4NNH3_9ACTN|nr:hypothetical protein WN71_033345 [Streptomyces mangrovisoli]
MLNPLWIISLFLGLAEVTVGVAASQAHGWIQGMLAVFSVAFPSAVAVAFFRILLTRPFVLYAPKDYSDPPSIETYVAAISSSAGRSWENVETAVRTALTEVVVPRLPLEDRARPQALVEEAVRAARQDFQRRSVEIDLSGIEASIETKVLSFPVDSMTVSDLLDTIYVSIREYVDIESYGLEWVLRDAATGRIFTEVGRSWRRARRLDPNDARSLQEVGIDPGARLLAIRPTG